MSLKPKLLGLAVYLIAVLAVGTPLFLVNQVAAAPGYSVAYNPYAGVDWNSVLRLKTQLHCHTTESDGGNSPYTVINQYAAYGFDALAISDHNELTWPWSKWTQYLDPTSQNMIAVPNEEVSMKTVHFITPFLTNEVNTRIYRTSVQKALKAAVAMDGIPVISHPWLMGFTLTALDAWTGFQGIEIYNPTEGGIRPSNFQLWDHLLTDPYRAQHIWGFAVDDSHDAGDKNQGWIVVYASQKDAASMKQSIVAGNFIAVVGSSAQINSITQVGNKLVIDTVSPVVWKADGQKIVGTTNTIDLSTLGTGYTYIRAEVNNGQVFTQPIFITHVGIQQILPGDVTGAMGVPDKKVDIRDLAAIAKLCGVSYPDPRYDVSCDLTGPTPGVPDGKIDLNDLYAAAENFAKYIA